MAPSTKPASPNPPTVSELLAQLRKIKEKQRALAKEELLVVKKIKAQIAAKRQKIDAAEQELVKIVPPSPSPSATSGCVERRFTVYSEPPGALVYHNGLYLGATPVDGYMVSSGKQKFRLIKEGYETLDIVQDYPPRYDWPWIDFISQYICPLKLREVRRFSYMLRPLQSMALDGVNGR